MAGKDDKYWGGHYGPMMSNATVRVKRQTKPNPGDAFNDIVHEESATALAQHQAARDKLIAAVIAEHGHLLTDSDVTAEDVTASSSDAMQAHHQPVRPRRARKKKKKREIRVFVSSTFRDFKAEREELIKKTFREVRWLVSTSADVMLFMCVYIPLLCSTLCSISEGSCLVLLGRSTKCARIAASFSRTST